MPAKRYLFYISQNYSFAILRPLQSAILERQGQVAWFIEGSNVSLDFFSSEEVLLDTVKDIYDFMPDAILHPASIAPTFLPGISVSVFHGFDAGKLDSRGQNDHFKIRNCFDLYCTQGPNTTSPFVELQKKHPHFTVCETGWCALDPLFTEQKRTVPSRKKHILMCSTFSKRLSCAPLIFEKIKKLSATGRWQWTIQFHPKMDQSVVEKYKSIQSEYLDFVETSDVIPLLQQADIMLCDTSSVLIMFALQNKPVVTFNNANPQSYMINIDSSDKLEAALEEALSYPPHIMHELKILVSKTHPIQDGRSSHRTLDAIDDVIDNQLAKKKPFDLFRQIKVRRKLNYWKI